MCRRSGSFNCDDDDIMIMIMPPLFSAAGDAYRQTRPKSSPGGLSVSHRKVRMALRAVSKAVMIDWSPLRFDWQILECSADTTPEDRGDS